MHAHPLLSSNALLASAATGAASALQQAAQGTLNVSPWVYSLIAVGLGFAGVWLARLVTIDAENKRLGRRQTLRETWPLTWVGVLIVCPLIWHYQVAIPWASMIGLGVGYTVRIVLRLLGESAVDAARAIARRAAAAAAQDLEHLPPVPPPPPQSLLGPQPEAVVIPPTDRPAEMTRLIERLDEVDDRPGDVA